MGSDYSNTWLLTTRRNSYAPDKPLTRLGDPITSPGAVKTSVIAVASSLKDSVGPFPFTLRGCDSKGKPGIDDVQVNKIPAPPFQPVDGIFRVIRGLYIFHKMVLRLSVI